MALKGVSLAVAMIRGTRFLGIANCGGCASITRGSYWVPRFRHNILLVSIKTSKNYQIGVFFLSSRVLKNDHGVKPFPKTRSTPTASSVDGKGINEKPNHPGRP